MAVTKRQREFLEAAAAQVGAPHPIVRRSRMSGWRASAAWVVGVQSFTEATGEILERLALIEPIPAGPDKAGTMKVRSAVRGATLGYAYRLTAAGRAAIQKES